MIYVILGFTYLVYGLWTVLDLALAWPEIKEAVEAEARRRKEKEENLHGTVAP